MCTSFLCPRPQFVDRFLLLFIPDKYKPDHEYVRHVPNRWIHAFTLTQVVCIVILAVVKETQASIVFPIAVGHTELCSNCCESIATAGYVVWE